ncbi:hypothetical protein SBF1_750013 [Candidatus Desulfosporosinus infrequens]|uniref:Uncharacterized protein n=1 Tax=Candidatus Desulfosporosinus infrequens TaxID=2043169 RepID=A0A2U3LR85_9FIRM|nr:hypothetical protein SBF1_750013 [Candidatus Desulfosporosinus infrequens]
MDLSGEEVETLPDALRLVPAGTALGRIFQALPLGQENASPPRQIIPGSHAQGEKFSRRKFVLGPLHWVFLLGLW